MRDAPAEESAGAFFWGTPGGRIPPTAFLGGRVCELIACSIRRFLRPNEGLGAASPAKAKAALEALPVATLEFNLDRTPNGQHSRFRDFAGQSGERRVENSPSPPPGGAANTCSPYRPANCL